MDLITELVDKGDTFYTMTREYQQDTYGGWLDTPAWRQGAAFKADLEADTTVTARIGEKLGVTSVYTLTTRKSVGLEPLAVFRRARDNKTFKITSEKKQTPGSATINMAVYTAEDYVITGDANG